MCVTDESPQSFHLIALLHNESLPPSRHKTNTTIMPSFNFYKSEKAEWDDVVRRRELLIPILEEPYDAEGVTTKQTQPPPTFFKHFLCLGVPIGFAVPLTVRFFIAWYIKHGNGSLPSALVYGTMPVIISVLCGIVLITNVVYIYIALKKPSPPVDITATAGLIIGFCCAWVILDVLWCNTVDMLPVVLIMIYAFAYHKFVTTEKKERAEGPDSCSLV